MKKFLTLLYAVAFVMGLAGNASAIPVTFFGEDLGGGRTNADLAHDNFMSNLTGVGTEDFESFTFGTHAPLTLDFGSAGTATLTGSGYIRTSPSAGRWATSGTHYWSAQTGDFVISFSDPISAFGFYGTDIGDFGGSLQITYANGTTHTLDVGNTVGSHGSTNGSVLYFGFYEDDPNMAFTSVAFINNSNVDIFGFDDMTIGTYQQITPNNPVPEPATILMMGVGLLGIVGYSLKSSKKS